MEVNNDDNRISNKLTYSKLEREPYSKKPNITAFSISSSKEIRSQKLPESLKNARYLDLL